MNAALFKCSRCDGENLATAADYIVSNWWPGAPTAMSYIFSTEVLMEWYRLRHKTPGLSEIKFVEILEEASKAAGRVSSKHYSGIFE